MPLARGAREFTASTMNQRHNRKAATKVSDETNELHTSGCESHETESLFAAEAAYADSIFRSALAPFGDLSWVRVRKAIPSLASSQVKRLSKGTFEETDERINVTGSRSASS